MATLEDYERYAQEKEEAERRNPLLKLGLGELVLEMQRISVQDPHVLSPENEVPEESREKYTRYIAIASEINRRESEYQEYKPAPKYS